MSKKQARSIATCEREEAQRTHKWTKHAFHSSIFGGSLKMEASSSQTSDSSQNIIENPSENQPTAHNYIVEQGRELYIGDNVYYDENGSVYVHSYPQLPQEIYHEEIVGGEYDESLPSTSSAPPPATNKLRLIKDPPSTYPSSTVLLTNESLKAENATYMAKSGKRPKREVVEEKKVATINKNGSLLNKNMPGMTNMFKVLTESAIKKTVEQLKQEAMEEEEEEIEMKEVTATNSEDVDDDSPHTPPPMERLGVDGNEFQSAVYDQWPLYNNRSIDFKEACELLIGIQQIDDEKICKTVPLQFKHEGTFLIDLRTVHDVHRDDNGGWEVPSGKTRFYKETEDGSLCRVDDGKGRLKSGIKDDFTFKILLKRYENRVTRGADDGRGHFQKKIYTGYKGITRGPFAIVTYSWHSGRPWNFVPPISIERTTIKRKTNWEKKSYEKVNMTSMPQIVSSFYEGFNIYSHCIINFDEAAAIMLGATVVDTNKLCSSVPLGYRQNGTFVIDLKRMGHCVLELRRDDNGLWHKPSGFSRFYKFNEIGDAERVDKAGKLPPGADFDVKIASKRYEHAQVDKKFVRKIYTAKGKNSESFPGSPEYAVMVYYWKGEPIQFEPAFKQNGVRTDAKEYARYQQIADEEQEFVETSGTMPPDEEHIVMEKDLQPPPLKRAYPPESTENLLDLKMTLIRREMENQDRFSAVLDRADALLARMEQRFGVEHVYDTDAPGNVVQEWNGEEQIIQEEVVIQEY